MITGRSVWFLPFFILFWGTYQNKTKVLYEMKKEKHVNTSQEILETL